MDYLSSKRCENVQSSQLYFVLPSRDVQGSVEERREIKSKDTRGECEFVCEFVNYHLYFFLSTFVSLRDGRARETTIYTLFHQREPRGLSPSRPYVENRPVAVSAAGREQVVIVRLAVGMTLPLEEVTRAQLLVAVSAREVFRMPRLAQGSYHLQQQQGYIIESEIDRQPARLSPELSSIEFSIGRATDRTATWPTMGFSQALQHPF